MCTKLVLKLYNLLVKCTITLLSSQMCTKLVLKLYNLLVSVQLPC